MDNKYYEQLNSYIQTLKGYIQTNANQTGEAFDKIEQLEAEIKRMNGVVIAIANRGSGTGGGGSSDNIYNIDGTLTGARTVDQDGNKLSLMNGDLQLGDYPNTRNDGGSYVLGTSTESPGMTAGGGATFSGTYTGGASTGYVVQVYDNKGNKWKWYENGVLIASGLTISTGSPILLSNGISVTFNGAGTGYTYPATLSAPIDSIGDVPENFLYTDISGNTKSGLLSDVIPVIPDALTASNGLNISGISGNIELGGLLTKHTEITGNGAFNLILGKAISRLGAFNVYTASDIIMSSNNVIYLYGNIYTRIGSQYSVQIQTPDVNSSTATAGQVLTLQNAYTGEVEYTNAAAGVLPAYATTALAAADVALTTGMFFKVTNGDGTSAIHVKD